MMLFFAENGDLDLVLYIFKIEDRSKERKQSTIGRFFGDRTLDFFAEARGAFYAAAFLRLFVIS